LSSVKSRTIDVEIYDQKYSIVLKSALQDSDVREIAEEIDARMREIASVASTADSLKIAVLTALHLAQELRDLRQNYAESDILIQKRSDEWTHVLEELLKK
jgi:cell division protein ZapA